MLCTRDAFGGHTVELAGRVVHPHHQASGIGSRLLEQYLSENSTSNIATYSRNPAVLKMLAKVCGGLNNVYPVANNCGQFELAEAMTHATVYSDGYVYHLNRYGEGGLFGAEDPADRLFTRNKTLKSQFTGLVSVRNALVIVARPDGNEL